MEARWVLRNLFLSAFFANVIAQINNKNSNSSFDLFQRSGYKTWFIAIVNNRTVKANCDVNTVEEMSNVQKRDNYI